MSGVRVLRERDGDALLDLCARDAVANLFVASRVARYGVERRRLGCEVLGYFAGQGGEELVSALHVGANLVPVGLTEEACKAFVSHLGSSRGCSSIMGPQRSVTSLYGTLSHRHRAWRGPREVRDTQPLLLLDGEPTVEPDPHVERIGMEHFHSYYDASVRMYTEEVGVSPVGTDSSYAEHVRRTIKEGRAFGVVVRGQVVYKSDVGAELGTVCQVQGVWLDPRWRGRGLAPGAMAGVATLAREDYPLVSLYVNDFNTPALATYARVGFRRVGTMATVLY